MKPADLAKLLLLLPYIIEGARRLKPALDALWQAEALSLADLLDDETIHEAAERGAQALDALLDLLPPLPPQLEELEDDVYYILIKAHLTRKRNSYRAASRNAARLREKLANPPKHWGPKIKANKRALLDKLRRKSSAWDAAHRQPTADRGPVDPLNLPQ